MKKANELKKKNQRLITEGRVDERMRKTKVVFAFVFYLLIHLMVLAQPAAADGTAAPMTDATALLLLKDSFKDAADALSSWSSSTPPCGPPSHWSGVICLHGIVIGLRLANLGLSGTINVDALSHFKGLRSVSLNSNNLSGPLPPGLARVRTMRSLFLSHNRFDGEIPDAVFGSMRRLKKLWLDHNQFSGPIPTSIFNATKLTELRLDDNAFDGLIPSFNLSSLKSFNASNNHLTGPIPASLARFDASSFAGNPDLCGPPLSSTPCPTPGPPPTMVELPKEQSSFGKTLAILVGIAVAVAALVAIVTLLRGRRREGKFDALSMVASAEAMESAAVAAPPQVPGSIQKQAEESGSSHKRSGSRRGTGTAAVRGAAELVMINEDKGAFSLTDMMKATAEVLGNGGLGSAYKAAMANGLTVVVKRMRDANRIGKEAFDGEMRRIGKLRHPNVLTPLAYHYRKEEKLIVSEYVPMGSLRYVLHGDRGPNHQALDWPTRLKIARGMARGMAYLHAELAALDVPHGNLKSANVLLGDDFEPMITDHGLAALVGAAQASQVMFSYRTPEGTQHRLVSPKSDVYCLGIVILELITGKFPSQYINNTKGGTDVVQWAASAIAEKREAELLDRVIASHPSTGDMVRLLRVGAACVDPDPEQRPEMADVAVLIGEIADATAVEQ
ncbi:inactive leucine-rich repeat receptor-like protein kinase [Musa troglodytarum]|uniref:Inactive leucine-rich repeat receptor-like protein kinase n=1 Tax=Musa troglodytarum TaxID=320322 RepID=A0A9E7JWS3_9LILI|nr:inactive leucine-rich repeat receptor-like protein kinase [Musa troglodytarum]